jgi:hypothetical protein
MESPMAQAVGLFACAPRLVGFPSRVRPFLVATQTVPYNQDVYSRLGSLEDLSMRAFPLLSCFLLAYACVSPGPTLLATSAPDKEFAGSLVSLSGDSVLLGDALKQLAKQSGIEVLDRRRKGADDPKLKIDLKNVPFWQALDTIAKQSNLRVDLYQPDGRIALVNGPHQSMPVSYHGLFRIALKRLTATLDFETGARFYVANLEIAWEPRFQALLLESRPQGLVIKDNSGHDLRFEDEGGGKRAVDGRIATVVELRLPAPARSVKQLGLLKGGMTLVGSSKMLTFEFDTLAKEKMAKESKRTQDGVTVRLSKLDLAADHWTVQVTLDYPVGGPKFESFQSWVVNNQIYLKKTDGKGQFPNNGSWSTISLGSRKAVLEYHFIDKGGKKRGKPSDWKVVYRTPSPMMELPIPFEFRDLTLP